MKNTLGNISKTEFENIEYTFEQKLKHLSKYLIEDFKYTYDIEDDFIVNKDYFRKNYIIEQSLNEVGSEFSFSIDTSKTNESYKLFEFTNPINRDLRSNFGISTNVVDKDDIKWFTDLGFKKIKLIIRDLRKHFKFNINITIDIIDVYTLKFTFEIPFLIGEDLTEKLSKTKKISSIKSKINSFDNNIVKRINNQKSKFKTCPNCQSKFNIIYVKSVYCPMCDSKDFGYTNTDIYNYQKLTQTLNKLEN